VAVAAQFRIMPQPATVGPVVLVRIAVPQADMVQTEIGVTQVEQVAQPATAM
jgi:hypothetical protein